MNLNCKHKNLLEKSAGELPIEHWQELGNLLRILFKENLERASDDAKTFEKKWFDVIEKNNFTELLFPSYSVLKTFGETLVFEDRKDETEGINAKQNEPDSADFSSDAIVAVYQRLLAGSLKTISVALENLRRETKSWDRLDNKKLFSKWIECADDAHTEWILTSEFSNDFGKLFNFYISRSSKEM